MSRPKANKNRNSMVNLVSVRSSGKRMRAGVRWGWVARLAWSKGNSKGVEFQPDLCVRAAPTTCAATWSHASACSQARPQAARLFAGGALHAGVSRSTARPPTVTPRSERWPHRCSVPPGPNVAPFLTPGTIPAVLLCCRQSSGAWMGQGRHRRWALRVSRPQAPRSRLKYTGHTGSHATLNLSHTWQTVTSLWRVCDGRQVEASSHWPWPSSAWCKWTGDGTAFAHAPSHGGGANDGSPDPSASQNHPPRLSLRMACPRSEGCRPVDPPTRCRCVQQPRPALQRTQASARRGGTQPWAVCSARTSALTWPLHARAARLTHTHPSTAAESGMSETTSVVGWQDG